LRTQLRVGTRNRLRAVCWLSVLAPRSLRLGWRSWLLIALSISFQSKPWWKQKLLVLRTDHCLGQLGAISS
jgi:hypothetical protein